MKRNMHPRTSGPKANTNTHRGKGSVSTSGSNSGPNAGPNAGPKATSSYQLASRPGSVRPKTETAKEAKDIMKLVKEVERDVQFSFALRVIRSMIMTNKVTFSAKEGASSKAVVLAKNLQSRWDDSLRFAIESVGYGRVAFEKVYGEELTDDLRKVQILECLDPLPFEISEMKLDKAGAFAGIKLKNQPGQPLKTTTSQDQKPDIEAANAWWCALDPTPLEPHGKSRYVGAVAQLSKERIDFRENKRKFIKRYSIGHGIARYPEPKAGEGEQDANHPRNVLAAEVSNIESGGVLLLSSSQYQDANGNPNGQYQYDYKQSEGLKDTSMLQAEQVYLDTCSFRAFGLPERAISQDSAVGSYSLAQAHQIVMFATCDDIEGQILRSFERGVVEPAEELNDLPKGSIVVMWKPLKDQAEEAAKAAAANAAGMFGANGIPGQSIPGQAGPSTVVDSLAGQSGQPGQTFDPSNPLSLDPYADDANTPVNDPIAGQSDDSVDVAATALNGAQIASLVDVIQQVAAGQLPVDSARPILQAAFPTLSIDVINQIVQPVVNFTPTTPSDPNATVQARTNLATGIVYRMAVTAANRAVNQAPNQAASRSTVKRSMAGGKPGPSGNRPGSSNLAPDIIQDSAEIAEQAIADAAEVFKQIKKAAANPKQVDRRSLRRSPRKT